MDDDFPVTVPRKTANQSEPSGEWQIFARCQPVEESVEDPWVCGCQIWSTKKISKMTKKWR
ncbi:hypothetical protein [Ruegeria arenilitoris]|uniref:hypothetical protein n=1 Tax=Ruegeria arenilitoris TaxID=1173585 RepID=UPI001481A6BA|nr:hypothetical protein [Ruegeria arenilitoris]